MCLCLGTSSYCTAWRYKRILTNTCVGAKNESGGTNIDYFIMSTRLPGAVDCCQADFDAPFAPHFGLILTLSAKLKQLQGGAGASCILVGACCGLVNTRCSSLTDLYASLLWWVVLRASELYLACCMAYCTNRVRFLIRRVLLIIR